MHHLDKYSNKSSFTLEASKIGLTIGIFSGNMKTESNKESVLCKCWCLRTVENVFSTLIKVYQMCIGQVTSAPVNDLK